jgi:uncharacterized protein YaaR (DUF327 family)
VKKLILDQNDDIAYYKNLVKECSQSVIDLVNLCALAKKTCFTDEGTEEEKKVVEEALTNVIDAYLHGDHNNALTHKGSDVEPEMVRKVDKILDDLKAEKEAEEAKDVEV